MVHMYIPILASQLRNFTTSLESIQRSIHYKYQFIMPHARRAVCQLIYDIHLSSPFLAQKRESCNNYVFCNCSTI
uniref:Putative ovule protein n=1 Tax=Solanum chacoense TaxID=4108 RepID=A0A0V0GQN3_SOLCH